MIEVEQGIRTGVRQLCAKFGDAYWRKLDTERAYPEDFVNELAKAGWLGALIPEEYGGSGLGIREASVIVEEIHRSGANAAACHAQMYIMGTLLRHGSDEQKRRYLPKIAAGELRLQAFGVTEPDAGSDTTAIKTVAVRKGDRYVINGQKVFISRALQSDMMILLARTTPLDKVEKRTEGISVFLVDLREAGDAVTITPLDTMMNYSTTQMFIQDLEVPPDALIGEEDRGFRYIIDGWNAERILIAAECIGDGRWFIDRAVRYANERVVFGRPIGANQGVQFPIAHSHAQIEAANLMRWRAGELFDSGQSCGAEANMAKLLASEASWQAANVCLDTHGGYGFACEFDVERKFRETRLYTIAPVNNNLILAYLSQNILGLPRSY
jgi:acyl-CoA dehydrogenase